MLLRVICLLMMTCCLLSESIIMADDFLTDNRGCTVTLDVVLFAQCNLNQKKKEKKRKEMRTTWEYWVRKDNTAFQEVWVCLRFLIWQAHTSSLVTFSLPCLAFFSLLFEKAYIEYVFSSLSGPLTPSFPLFCACQAAKAKAATSSLCEPVFGFL